MKLIIGSHVSYKKNEGLVGSVEEALSYSENTFMFYTGAPQNTIRASIDEKNTKKAKGIMEREGIDIKNVIIHAPYIINLANKEKHQFAVDFLKKEIERAEIFGVDKIVLHPGSHVGIGTEEGIKNIARGLNEVLKGDGPIICLETMAGKGSEIGKSFEEINEIIEKCISDGNTESYLSYGQRS